MLTSSKMNNLKEQKTKKEELKEIAKIVRRQCIEISGSKRIPHLGSCLSCLELLVVVYWNVLNLNIDNSQDENRDRFLLSKGHASPIMLQILALRGFFDISELQHFGEDGSYFHEHPPKPGYIPGVEAATGSLGHGFSMGIGMATAAKIQGKDYRVYCLLGDGECNEGVIWEGALVAPKLQLDNLIVIIDYNKWQATGRSQEITALEPLSKKWESFGWNVQEIDGHDIEQIIAGLKNTKMKQNRPHAIIAHTVKGKGVSFMEDDNNWHYRTPNSEELELALNEVKEAK